MGAKKVREKLLSFALALCMLVGIVPVSAFAAQDTSVDTTGTNVEIVASYAQQLVNANRKDDDDYSKGGFTWDTEGKKDSWRYFNGVMMDAFLMLDQGTTAKTAIGTYVDAFYNSNINDDGTIKNYITGELDSVPTALGLFDLLGSTNADKYKKAIQYIYTQLEGQTSYEKCGGNYLHKQKSESDGTPTSSWSTWNIGLDGLYMAQPFLMECANAIDEGTLTLTDAAGKAVTSAAIYEAVYNRFAWVAEKMYDETTGLYHHGWNVSKSKGNGHFWGRGIGWYAVALVDVIEMMPADYRTQMIPYLTKLFDGMLNYQDAKTGMWYNVVNNYKLSGNKLETSVSAMMAYALMKAYNNGYVTDAKYGQAGLAAFNGVIAKKVTGSEGNYTVADIYQKSGVGDSDEYYTENSYVADEAKGVGPLIMAATVANTTAKNLPATETPEEQPSVVTVTDDDSGVSVSATNVTGITVEDKSGDSAVASALNGKLAKGFFAYDITLDGYTKGDTATVTMPAPSGANAVYYVSDDGSTVEEIEGATFGDGTVTFTTTHFSTYAAGNRSTGGSSTGGSTDDSPSVDKTEENWGLRPAEDYPEYPADGAVRIDKTATTGQDFNSTGVVKVELDAAGISVKQGVDVVLVVDVSNSMGWTDNWFEGMEEDEVAGAKDNVKIPQGSAGSTTDKLDQAMASAQKFADILLAGNTAGASSNNSISFVTFAGFDKDNTNESEKNKNYIDSVQTVFTNVQDADSANTAFENTRFTDYKVDGTSVTYTLQIGSRTVRGTNRGNTNYDYAFAEANAAVNELKDSYGGASAYAETGRETVVVFMTDGAPSHYNNNRLNGSHADTRYGTEDEYAEVGAYNGREEDNAETWLNYIKNPNTYARTLNKNINSFYAVGFDLAHGGFGNYSFAEGDLQPVLEGLAGDNTVDVELVSNGTALQAFYRSLAQKIKLAGTEAQVTDTINSEFTLQTTAFGAPDAETRTNPTIEVTSYDLYTKATATTDPTLIGTRTGTSTTLETVTFNADGTAAYSDQIGGGTTNIMSTANGVTTIAAKYFTYTKDAASGVEKFVWNIGDITDDEVALSYYAYLTGTMEGTREKGEVYYTNEGATLEYVDINGKYAKKVFPMPAVAWGGATTSFEYYLVNEMGKPVNHAGQEVPFANRIVLYGDSVALNLNQDITIPAQTINASAHLPEGYVLYDVEAYYTVSTASDSSLNKGITVSEPSEKAKEAPQTGAQTTIIVYPQNPTANETYIQTRVAFGVRWDLTPSYAEYELVKDQIVLDYGKAIQADVLANDTTIPKGYTGTLVGFTAYNANANLKQMQQSAGSATYTTDNGTYTIVDGKVNFQLSTMLSEVEKVFCVVQVTETADTTNYYYLYEELDIIPATSVYYETDFADGVFTFDNTSGWDTATVANDVVADGPQDDGTIGVNQTYGYDSTYTDDTSYSNGSSYRINGDKATDKGDCTTKASFTFTGTGFDLISRTGEEDGQIRVTISNASGTVKTVKVLNKSETELTLYQIPVVSVNDLAYGTYNVLIEVYKETTYTGNLASLSRGNLFYFDAVRIYDPLDASKAASAASDAGIAYAAYTADGEADATVTEIRSKILDQKTYDGGREVVDNTVVFVDRTYETDENGAVKATGVEVADYETIGPNNEVYLAKGQGIAFQLTSTATPASIDIGAKSANGAPVTLNASLYSKDNNYSTSISEVINSCTAQNYNLMADAAEDSVTTETILSGGGAYVVIFNDGNGVLSLTDLKVAYGNTSGVATLAGTPEAVEAAGKAMSDDTSAEEQPEEQPNYDILSASFDSETCKLRKYATMTVITTADVVKLKVVDYKNREVSADITSTTENNRTTWKLSIQMTNAGTRSYTVTGYGADTTAGASASAEITVTRK